MANTTQSAKRARQSETRYAIIKARRSRIRTYLRKVEEARRRIAASGRDVRLEIDGGIKPGNIRRAADAGADTFVAGSAIFGAPDYAAVIAEMRAALG